MKRKFYFVILFASIVYVASKCNDDVIVDTIDIVAETVPTPPLPLVPTDSQEDVVSNTALSWRASRDDDYDPITYSVYLDTINPPKRLVVEGQKEIGYTPTDQRRGVTYYWQVTVEDIKGAVAKSKIVSYTTTTNRPPPAPILSWPTKDNNTVPLQTKLVWEASIDVDKDEVIYDVYIGTDSTEMNKVSEGQKEIEYELEKLVNRATYYWQIIANDGKAQTRSEMWSFIAKPNAHPTRPELISPSRRAKNTELRPQLIWKRSLDEDNDTVRYDLFFDTVLPPKVMVSANLRDTTYATPLLTNSTTYYWQVRATDGKSRTKSYTSTFTTKPNVPPTKPEIISPTDGKVDEPFRTKLRWKESTNSDRDPITYDVYFDTRNPPTGLIETNTTLRELQLPPLAKGENFYWQVVAKDGKTEVRGDVWHFKTVPNKLPTKPTIVSPLRSQTKVVTRLSLVWGESTDADGDAVTYDVYFGTQNPPRNRISTSQRETRDTLPVLEFDTKYYWQVVSKDPTDRVEGDIWTFETKRNSPPDKPKLQAPINNSASVTSPLNLAWVRSKDIDFDPIVYDLYLSTSNPPTTKVSSDVSSLTHLLSSLPKGVKHYWKVVAKDGEVEVSSDIWSFTTRSNQPPSPPVPVIPTDGQVDTRVNPELVWQTSSDPDGDAITYDVYISTTSPPTTKVGTGIVGTRYTPSGQSLNTTYYWRVEAKDTEGAITTSDIFRYEARSNRRWQEDASTAAWGERHAHATLRFDNKLWLIGGLQSGVGDRNDVWYSSDGSNWTQASSNAPWRARSFHSTLVFDNKMWIIGGDNNRRQIHRDVWSSTNGVNWTQVNGNAAFAERSDHASTVFNGRMWVSGGYNNRLKSRNDIWYSSNGRDWILANGSAPWGARVGHTMLSFGGKMWIIGGVNDRNETLKDVWSSTDGVTWSLETNTPPWETRASHLGEVFDGKMWMAGGYMIKAEPRSGGTFFSTHYLDDVWYSTDGVNWTQDTDASKIGKRAFGASATSNNKLWIIGGIIQNGDGVTRGNVTYKSDVWSRGR